MLEIKNPEIKFAIEAVRQAASLVRLVQSEMVSTAIEKQDRSPVTIADYASQALIGHMLSKAFPNDAMIAEEDSAFLRQPKAAETLDDVAHFVARYKPQAGPKEVCAWIDHGRVDSASRYWTLDPIDGTKGFLRGDQYAVALALVVNGQVQVGVLGCPNLTGAYQPDKSGPGSLAAAALGQGAWTTSLEEGSQPGEFTSLSVSQRADPTQGRILRSFESGHTNVDQIGDFAQALGVQAEPVRMDSQAKYALLAAGHGEFYLRLLSPFRPDYREKVWDQAAGSIILAEAGGRITDLHGRALDFSAGRTLAHNRGILASNSALHEAALQALRNIGV